jgi:hypothetical protein
LRGLCRIPSRDQRSSRIQLGENSGSHLQQVHGTGEPDQSRLKGLIACVCHLRSLALTVWQAEAQSGRAPAKAEKKVGHQHQPQQKKLLCDHR